MITATDLLKIPQYKRGMVWCCECGSKQEVDAVKATLGDGWPECCGYTMTLDSPEERIAFDLANKAGEAPVG